MRARRAGPRGWDEVALSPAQRQGIDWLDLMSGRHTMHGLVELDVTGTREAIRAWRRRTGEPMSLTAVLVASLGRAVAADPLMQAHRHGRSGVVAFRDVDVALLVERIVGGERHPVPAIVRAANRKTPRRIEADIREATAGAVPQSRGLRWLPAWLLVPAAIRRRIWRLVLRDPWRSRRLTGTVTVTAVGMFGAGAGWGVGPSYHTLAVIVGGVARRPAVIHSPNGSTEIGERQWLSLTLNVDHDVVNGAPVARFVQRLRQLVESAAVLDDATGAGPGARSG